MSIEADNSVEKDEDDIEKYINQDLITNETETACFATNLTFANVSLSDSSKSCF